MKDREKIDASRIEKAIYYIIENFQSRPDLDEIAKKIHLSPFHFQKLFTKWAGVSPEKFLQYISIDHAKKMLNNQASLLNAAFDSSLSGIGRLHDLFIKIEGMTPGEYKNGGENLAINYCYEKTPFDKIIIAATKKGICKILFANSETEGLNSLQNIFPNATYKKTLDEMQKNALNIFSNYLSKPSQIKLHLKGTEFQIKVWEALLKIPAGNLSTYGNIARQIKKDKASRAVGSAIGANPVAFLIPCHRVIQSSGKFGQYHWGSAKKLAMIGFEAACSDRNKG